MVRRIQLGLRLEEDLVKRIEILAEAEGIDRNLWIKRALADFANQEEDSMAKEAVKSYINLTIDDEELKDHTGFKNIPKDIQDARKEMLNKTKKGE